MAHLAPQGISEDWWLKYLGDVHWQLIAQAVGQNTTVFRDRRGRQLYAAFCATEFEQTHPSLARLGEEVDVHSELRSAGRSRIQSNHILCIHGTEIARFRLVSTFVAHVEAGVNASVRRATPYLIPVLDPATDDFATRAAALAKRQKSEIGDDTIKTTPYTPIGSDFNAVGLLYFPSFTRVFDEVAFEGETSMRWNPVKYRKIVYLANIELGEQVVGAFSMGSRNAIDLWGYPSNADMRRKLAHCLVWRHRGI
ncbi:Pnap_2097 family protein [Shimia marina]|nr:Pnap_2097 family protein [Shimia marina]